MLVAISGEVIDYGAASSSLAFHLDPHSHFYAIDDGLRLEQGKNGHGVDHLWGYWYLELICVDVADEIGFRGFIALEQLHCLFCGETKCRIQARHNDIVKFLEDGVGGFRIKPDIEFCRIESVQAGKCI